jgi:hypothetical protein
MPSAELSEKVRLLSRQQRIAVLEAISEDQNKNVEARNLEEAVLYYAFAYAGDDWKDVTPFLATIPPNDLMCIVIKGGLGGIPTLFTAFWGAKTETAKERIIAAIKRSFDGFTFDVKAPTDAYVKAVESWYTENKNRIKLDKDFPCKVNSFGPGPIPEGMKTLGVFFVPNEMPLTLKLSPN